MEKKNSIIATASKLLALLLLLATARPALPQAQLPAVETMDVEALRTNIRWLLQQPRLLPGATADELRALASDQSIKAEEWAAKVQKLLDPHCLLAVSINSESRVKAARGPARALLRQDDKTLFL